MVEPPLVVPLLAQPTLVLCGDDDPAIPVVNARILAGLMPNAELQVLPRAGHLVYFDDPEHTGALVAKFLSH